MANSSDAPTQPQLCLLALAGNISGFQDITKDGPPIMMMRREPGPRAIASTLSRREWHVAPARERTGRAQAT
jgi:hypothetical protein